MAQNLMGALLVCSFLSVAVQADAQEGMENTAEACRDNEDNDGDGSIDCMDSNCGYLAFCKDKVESLKGAENFDFRPGPTGCCSGRGVHGRA